MDGCGCPAVVVGMSPRRPAAPCAATHALLWLALRAHHQLLPSHPAPLPALPPPQERYNEIKDEMKHMLVRVGWKPDFVEKSVPILPISGWMGDNLIKKTENMGWWKGERCCGLAGWWWRRAACCTALCCPLASSPTRSLTPHQPPPAPQVWTPSLPTAPPTTSTPCWML